MYPLAGAPAADVVNNSIQWTAAQGAQAYELWIGTTPGSHDLLDSNQTQATSWSAPALPAGQTVYARIWTEAGNQWRSSDITFTVAPIARFIYPLANSTADVTNTAIQWTAVPGAQAYELWIGTSLGAQNLLDSNQTQQTSWVASVLPAGQTVFARIWTEAGNQWRSADISFTVAPIARFIYPPAGGTGVELVSTPVQWTSVPGAQAYELWIGTASGTHDVLDSNQTQATSFLPPPTLPIGAPLFARIWTESGNVWRSTDITFTLAPVSSFIAPVNNADNVDLSQPITWRSVAGAQAYELWVGSAPGANDLLDTGQTQAMSYVASALPSNQPLYARLWTEGSNVWRHVDIVFTPRSLIATFLQPAAGATNLGATQAFTWTAITGAQAYSLYVGTTAGANDVVNSNETQATTFTGTNLPANGLLYDRR